MLSIENLHKRYGEKTALHGLNLSVNAGEVYALLGPNGAGKTTTINCCLGFAKPDEGQVVVDGVDPAQNPLVARQALAYIPENVTLYGTLTGVENLEYFSELAGRRYRKNALKDFLSEAGLQTEAMNRRVNTYSKGMRQKVGIAIAMAKQAKILLLDEPTSGLDPRASHEFSILLERLSTDGMAILMATHDLFRAREVASRIGFMCNGYLESEIRAEQTTPEEMERVYLDITSDGSTHRDSVDYSK